MQIDVTRQIRAVTREVASRWRNGRAAKIVIAGRTYNSTSDDVWNALTQAGRIRRWFLPVSGDLRLGGRFQIENNAGGQVTACKPSRHLGLTWEYGGDVSWIDVRLSEEVSRKTTLVLEHLAHVGNDFWNQYGPGAVGVAWDLALLGLNQYLSTGTALNAQETAVWQTSAQGCAFIRGVSEAWSRAAVDAGTEPNAAAEAAGRTTAFYTGQPAPPSKWLFRKFSEEQRSNSPQ